MLAFHLNMQACCFIFQVPYLNSSPWVSFGASMKTPLMVHFRFFIDSWPSDLFNLVKPHGYRT